MLGGEAAWFARSASDAAGPDAGGAPVGMIRLISETGFAEKLARTLETILSQDPSGWKFEPADFRGFRIYSLRPLRDAGSPALPPQLHFAVASSFLLFSGDVNELREILSDFLETDRPALAQREDFRPRLQGLAPEYSGLLWYDAAKAVADALRKREAVPSVFRPLGRLLDAASVPSARDFEPYLGRFFAATWSYRDAWRLHAILDYPDEFSRN